MEKIMLIRAHPALLFFAPGNYPTKRCPVMRVAGSRIPTAAKTTVAERCDARNDATKRKCRLNKINSQVQAASLIFIAMKTSIFFLTIILAFSTLQAAAQLCQGSLGDPQINITFGAGPNPGKPLNAASTRYFFTSSSCPNDGFYTVVNSTSNCFGDSWFTLSKDHTGDPNGYFMLVNASIDTGDFYIDTVRGLCQNTTFEFAAWIANMLRTSACSGAGIEPKLSFSIETTAGQKLNTYNTGDIPSANGAWKQYGLFFATPPGVNDVVVRLTNKAPGGCGNDLALDDITFRPCGPQVSSTIKGQSGKSILDVCDYDTSSYVITSDVSAGYNNPSYQWQQSTDNINWTDISGQTGTTYKRLANQTPGNYYYRMAVAEAGNISSVNCRILSNVVTFHVVTKPQPVSSSNSPVCEGATLSLTSTQGATYNWTGPGGVTATGSPATINNIGFNNAGLYHVKVTSAAGCVSYDSTTVQVIAKPTADAGTDAAICNGQSITLNGNGTGSLSWSPAETLSDVSVNDPVATPADSTIYYLTVTDPLTNCTAVDSVHIAVHRLPSANAGPDKILIEGDGTNLQGTATGTAVTYSWKPDVYINYNNTLTPFVFPPRDTTYILSVTSELGCGTATDDVFIKVYKKVDVPNAFSPNGDGINDTWKIPALAAYPNATVFIYNRYGKEVFHASGNFTEWNGKYNGQDLPIGTYYYVIDLKAPVFPIRKGSVTILR